jgi:hypothetical protein
MSRLFTYIIPIDNGSAPNPFYGMCSLAICKPGIRRVAEVGDWIAGLGSKQALSGDLSGHLVYAMRVEKVLSFEEYDREAAKNWPHRIPKIQSMELAERLGDCIYSFQNGEPKLLPSVHGPGNKDTDLSGKNVLLSKDFYYFGRRAQLLPDHLRPICHQGQGHRSTSNGDYFDPFVTWVRSLAPAPGQYGWPDAVIDPSGTEFGCDCSPRKRDGENDTGC